MNWKDKTILITGASKGLGKELALHLSTYCSNLILTARSFESLRTLQNVIKNRTGKAPDIIKCDVSNPDEVKDLGLFIKAKYNKLDVLLNNAGIAEHKISENIGYDEMKKQFEVNFFGVFYCIQEMLPLLKNAQKGYILNIGSIADRVPFADNSVYAATKSAIKTYSRGLHLEMQKYGINVGIFNPGLMNTSFQDDRGEDEKKIPSFMILDTKKVVSKIKTMIENRKSKAYMYIWMTWLMRIKLIFG
jgi:short-subunit dehydrogenase